MKVIIMRGVPGSGKSRYVATKCQDAYVCSADKFFLSTDDEGQTHYRFEPSKLSAAHDECFREFRFACLTQAREIVVDNTNTRLFEMSPYVMLARSYGYALRIVHVVADPEECAKRNVHGVPLAAIKRMADNFEPTLPFWGAEEETYVWLGD
jgi:predicted kinase